MNPNNANSVPSLPQSDAQTGPALAPQAQNAPATAPSAAAFSAPHTPQIADDVDLIEREWIDKAKAIVEQTKNDPRQQSGEVEKLKASYLKQRFGKDIKVNET